ncbi:MAG: hypothetical protein ACJ8FZ_11730, partial [Bradyrhizobium sp.]
SPLPTRTCNLGKAVRAAARRLQLRARQPRAKATLNRRLKILVRIRPDNNEIQSPASAGLFYSRRLQAQ